MKKTYIIAELAQGFEGDKRLCHKYIKLAGLCGADAVKFQIFLAGELCTPDYKWNELFKSLEMPAEEWGDLVEYARSLNLGFYADVFGAETLTWLQKSGLTGIKVHSTDTKNHELLNQLKESRLQILLSTGGSTLDEVEAALEDLGDAEVVLMSGFQAEPNLYSDIELNKIGMLKESFGREVGYADHIDANDMMATVVPAMAVLKGATYIEKHLTIHRNHLQLEDHVSALDPAEFEEMVKMIRATEQFAQPGGYELSEREATYRRNSKKAVLAGQAIPKDTLLTRDHLALLRTGSPTENGIFDTALVVGKTTTAALQKGQVITEGDLE